MFDTHRVVMGKVRWLVAAIGILLPYLARIPGAFLKGPRWITDLLGAGPEAVLFLSAFHAICWGAILLAVCSFRRPTSAWFPAIFGFAVPAVAYASLDLRSSSTAAVAMVFVPIYSLPLLLLGWLIGRYFDRRAAPITAP